MSGVKQIQPKQRLGERLTSGESEIALRIGRVLTMAREVSAPWEPRVTTCVRQISRWAARFRVTY